MLSLFNNSSCREALAILVAMSLVFSSCRFPSKESNSQLRGNHSVSEKYANWQSRPLQTYEEVEYFTGNLSVYTERFLTCRYGKTIENNRVVHAFDDLLEANECEKLSYETNIDEQENNRLWLYNLLVAKDRATKESRAVRIGIWVDRISSDIDELFEVLKADISALNSWYFAQKVIGEKPFVAQKKYFMSWEYSRYLASLPSAVANYEIEQQMMLLKTINPRFALEGKEAQSIVENHLNNVGLLTLVNCLQKNRVSDNIKCRITLDDGGKIADVIRDQIYELFQGQIQAMTDRVDEILLKYILDYDLEFENLPILRRTLAELLLAAHKHYKENGVTSDADDVALENQISEPSESATQVDGQLLSGQDLLVDQPLDSTTDGAVTAAGNSAADGQAIAGDANSVSPKLLAEEAIVLEKWLETQRAYTSDLDGVMELAKAVVEAFQYIFWQENESKNIDDFAAIVDRVLERIDVTSQAAPSSYNPNFYAAQIRSAVVGIFSLDKLGIFRLINIGVGIYLANEGLKRMTSKLGAFGWAVGVLFIFNVSNAFLKMIFKMDNLYQIAANYLPKAVSATVGDAAVARAKELSAAWGRTLAKAGGAINRLIPQAVSNFGSSVFQAIKPFVTVLTIVLFVGVVFSLTNTVASWEYLDDSRRAMSVVNATVMVSQFTFAILSIVCKFSILAGGVFWLITSVVSVVIGFLMQFIKPRIVDLIPPDDDPSVVFFKSELHPCGNQANKNVAHRCNSSASRKRESSYWIWPDETNFLSNRVQNWVASELVITNIFKDSVIKGLAVGGHGGSSDFDLAGQNSRLMSRQTDTRISKIKVWNCKRDGWLKDLGFAYTIETDADRALYSSSVNKTITIGCGKGDKKKREKVKELVLSKEKGEYLKEVQIYHRILSGTRRVASLKFISNLHRKEQSSEMAESGPDKVTAIESIPYGPTCQGEPEGDGLASYGNPYNVLNRLSCDAQIEQEFKDADGQVSIYSNEVSFHADGRAIKSSGQIIGFHGKEGRSIDSLGIYTRVPGQRIMDARLYMDEPQCYKSQQDGCERTKWYHTMRRNTEFCTQFTMSDYELDEPLQDLYDVFADEEVSGVIPGRCDCTDYLSHDEDEDMKIFGQSSSCFLNPAAADE